MPLRSPQSPRPESNPAQTRNLWRRQASADSAAFVLLRSGTIENPEFDSHSLHHLHDFVRQLTILDYFVRDSALLGLDACAGRNNAGIDAHNVVQAQNASVRSVRPNTLDFRRHLEKVAPHSASFVVRCRLGVARGRFWRIVLKNSFSPIMENSQSCWCFSIASTRGTTPIAAETPAGARIGFTEHCSG